MGFLSDLGGLLNNQFGIGENTSNSLDGPTGDFKPAELGGEYSKLGGFRNKFDKSAERSYYEDGFIRDLRPRSRSVLFQQPDIFVVVKKRMFSTLVDNSRLDLLEEKERILIAASKRLFQNKCRLLSAYEKLTKIEQLSFESGRFNTYLAPKLFTLLETGSPLFSALGLNSSTKAALENLRRIVTYSEPGRLTNWTTNDLDAVFGTDIGEGPGTFEITNVASIRTSVSTEWGGGSASLTLEDPYNLLTITEKDIDQALTDVTNPMRTGMFFKFTDIELTNQIEKLKTELAIDRQKRNASQITFKVSPGTLLSKRVRAILDDEGVEIEFNYSTGIQNALSGLESENAFDAVSSVSNFFSIGSVSIAPKFIYGNDSEGLGRNNQLTSAEASKFSQIISNIYTVLDQRQTSRRELKKRNAEINYARNRMRLFFNGKYIIQPMDTITIWMNSRTDEDQRIPGGFKAQQNELGLDPIQRFDTIIKNINNNSFVRGSMKDPTGNFAKISFEDVERLSVVGPDVPVWLWRQLRQDLTSQPTGPCIFSGIVGKGGAGVSGSWADGKWTINVECEDNTGFFDKSKINFKPSADVFNSSIYDPLTPFDVSFDAATGVPITEIGQGEFPPLLPENQLLLQSGLATLRSGENKNKIATEERYKQPSKEISFGDFRAVLHDPEGMVYRWKQGIQTLTDTSRPNKTVSIDQERSVLLTNQPFAGQDVMNVMSLLITGQPYNYSTFLKAAIENGNSLGNDSVTGISAASTYIQGLISDIEKTNLIWGNFIPHKKLTVNKAYEQFIAEQRIEIVTLNENLKQKLNQRARIEDELILQLGGVVPDPSAFISAGEGGRAVAAESGSAVDAGGLGTARQTQIQLLSADIAKYQKEFDFTIKDKLSNNSKIGLTLIGNEINSNPTLTSIDDAGTTPAQKDRDELELRRKLYRYTARRFWQVRANEDQNLFIVDDQYDKNFDIQAFERQLNGKIEVFNSYYATISDQLTSVRKLLGLECFANTQGHIEARPPQYNRIPSSVFYKMFKDRDEIGVKVFPDFLENLYFNQIKGIFRQIEIIEDEIRLRAIALGARNDQDIMKLISGGESNIISDESFGFLTRFDGDGRIGTEDLRKLLVMSNPDFTEGLDDPGLKELSQFNSAISKQIRTNLLFPPSVQASAIANFNPDLKPDRQADIFDTIRDRLRIKTGREPKKLQDLFGNPKFRRLSSAEGTTTTVSRIDRLNVFDQIATHLSQRQQLMKSATNAIQHLQEGVAINAPDIQNENIFQGGLGNITKPSGSNKTARALTAPYLNRKTEIPQFLEHMIEYEDEDDIGVNSGRRFVLTADRIVSLTISENPPPYTMVTVKGLFGQGFTDAPAAFNQTSEGGNGITSAYAVDYDMWYQYGLRVSNAIEAPYLSDPDSQCAPFAVATLLEARENILQGSVDVAGYNEFYQPGDVVYIEDRNLLFYVKQVQHSFSYGSLKTTLQLTYGHSPGEYIPTMLDVVGKILYNAKGFTGQFRNERSQMIGSARSIGAVAFISNLTGAGEASRFPEGSEPIELLLKGPWGERNKKVLVNALFGASGSLNQVSFRRQSTKVKIVYYVTETSKSSEMQDLAFAISDWFKFPEGNTADGLQPLPNSNGMVIGLNKDDILIEEVDVSNPEQHIRTQIDVTTRNRSEPFPNTQGPSSAAIQVIRSLMKDPSASDFRNFLANTVLDIFVDYTAGGTVAGANGQTRGQCTMEITETDGSSESGQANNAAVNAARGGA